MSFNSSSCIFCLREFSNVNCDSEELNKGVTKLKHFLKSFQRYEREGGSTKFSDYLESIKRVSNNDCVISLVGACQDCSLLLQDFSDLFHQLKVLEMKLEWRLQSLKSIMKSADKVPWRRKKFQENLGNIENQGNAVFIEIKEFRRKFVGKISRKLKLAVPRVKLLRCPPISSENAIKCCNELNDPEIKPSSGSEQAPASNELVLGLADLKSEITTSVPFLAKQENLDIENGNQGDQDDSMSYSAKPTPTGPKTEENIKLQKEELILNASSDEAMEKNDDDCDSDKRSETSNASFSDTTDLQEESFSDSVKTENAKNTIPKSRFCLRRKALKSRITPSQTHAGVVPTLKELALQQTMELRYTCSVKGCRPSIKTYFHIGDLRRHSTHHGNFRCNFCKFEVDYSHNLSKHEIEEHSEKFEHNEKTVYKCPRCKFESCTLSVLKSHHSKAHLKLMPDRRTCAICHIDIYDHACTRINEMAWSHYLDWHDLEGINYDTIVRCDIQNCRAYFRTVDQLKRHQHLFHGGHSNDLHDLSKVKGMLSSLKDIALQQTLQMNYACSVEDCPANVRTFFNKYDLRNHSFHHGNFSCVYCDFQANYAPDLIMHEINEHSQEIKLEDVSLKKYKCPRCAYVAQGLRGLKNHHLKRHLKLTPNRRTCGVCKLPINKDASLKHAMVHYNNYHDLSGVNLKTVKWCKKENCNAYFRSSRQFLHHQIWAHGTKANKNWTKLRRHRPRRRGPVIKPKKNTLKSKHYGCSSWITKLSLSPHARKKIECKEVCNVDKCKNVFFSEVDFETHSKLHGIFQCLNCNKEVNHAYDLALHEMIHGKEKSDSRKRLACPRCDYSIPNLLKAKMALIRHFLKSHLDLTMDYHTCPVCEFQLSNYSKGKRGSENNCSALRLHLERNHDFALDTIHKCEEPECYAYFNTSAQLHVHRNNHTMNLDSNVRGEVKVQCKFCGKWLYDKRSLRTHIHRIHHKDFPYICSSHGCNARFQTQQEYDCHISGEMNLVKCQKCDKLFHGNAHLAAHSKRIHGKNKKPEGKRKCICEICGKEFKDAGNLRLHALSHSGPDSWEFSCHVCEKKCMTQHKLDEHLRTHTKEKPFTCHLCGVSYAHRHNLRHHMNNKHGGIDPPRKRQKLNVASENETGINPKKITSETSSSESRKSTRRRVKRRRTSSSVSSSSSEST